ncbi:TPA: aspartate 4-decarboxylase [Clostridium perfringens]|uniref:aspartate 4-decarboxylase n=1 Tax=Clostridium perfringens TaxID=1502 RepID=UPI001158A847|nr:aspartate 4-decarboxylase [Clostridium perfringens]EJT5919626.1 aspartate 4-decarboxylase [Clostridium perfringens]EJT5936347.1 aspartate 4-decarboxylase [Clostridium perfringens]ELC8400463.1 aspartate 4-decarboxylase [Clostridium perfringens]MDH5084900.1 Bifunctional aspartate aminotransferase and L-aspartate beta-decarboxylase [Clostridium perfringens]MDK0656401.1 aspartate 4-decarboxylase [Clostridium perfringens]
MTNKNLQLEELKKIYGKISPFEFKNKLIDLAKDKKSAHILLDAGRGNPNWTASTPRDAFFTFGHFAVSETKRTFESCDLAGIPHKEGVYNRFLKFIEENKNFPAIELLEKIIDYGIKEKGFNPDDFLYELCDAIIGDNYPYPDRMLPHIEAIVHDYLLKELCYLPPSKKFKLFAVEGATAAMCYIFDSLIANELLQRKDKIAIMTPIFTPYLEIPQLPRYDLESIYIHASEINEEGSYTWQYPEEELNKLKDPSIKALFLVNPSNPPSMAIHDKSKELLKDIVTNYNPNLMIISDDVYGTFVNKFQSLVADLPHNSIGVYSYSKYFGVTGWRLGTLALYEDNIFDKLISELPSEKKEMVNKRYESLSTDPEKIPFIDRIVADSRQVALNHTAGLSTPQQVQMAFFSAFSLVDKENTYKNQTIAICHRRQRLLFEGLDLPIKENPYDASYYAEFDLLQWALKNYGPEFANYLESNYKPVDVLYKLAEESSIVLLSGGGFQGPEWSVRISLANLDDDAYSEIGTVLRKILEDFVHHWKSSTK